MDEHAAATPTDGFTAVEPAFDCWLTSELAQLRLSPARLARLTGLSRSTISRLLRGERRPTVESATRIAVALDSMRPHGDVERRTDMVARVRHELAADPTLGRREVRQIMAHYVLQRAGGQPARRA